MDFDAVMMNFIVIGEIVGRLSGEFKEKYNQINWKKVLGFRNIVAHNYFGIDAEVWEIIFLGNNRLSSRKEAKAQRE